MYKQLIYVAAVSILVAACSSDLDGTTGDNTQEAIGSNSVVESPVMVATMALTAQEFRPEFSVVGAIQAAEEIVLSAELAAPVAKIHVREGQTIQRGNLLLELDSEKLQLQLTQAQQTLRQSQSRLQESRDNLTRRQQLAEQKTLSQELLDAANHEWQRATAAMAEAEAAVSLAKRNLTDTRILSPVNGVVDKRLVEVGETVQEAQLLLLIQATDQLEAKTFVSERNIHLLREGNKASLVLANWPDRTITATVQNVGIAGDARTGNFPVTLLVDETDIPLRPGMTTTIKIKGEAQGSALLIPESALFDHQRQRVVFVLEDGKASLRHPQLQVGLGDQIKVLSGIQVGEKVIVQTRRPLRGGMPVEEQTQVGGVVP